MTDHRLLSPPAAPAAAATPPLPYWLKWGDVEKLVTGRGLTRHDFLLFMERVPKHWPVPGTGPETGHRAKYQRDEVLELLGR